MGIFEDILALAQRSGMTDPLQGGAGTPPFMPSMSASAPTGQESPQEDAGEDPRVEGMLQDADTAATRRKQWDELVNSISNEMKRDRAKYREERVEAFKSKKNKFLLGVTEFLSGLGGKPGQIREQERLANEDYDAERKDLHERAMLANTMGTMLGRDQQFDLKRAQQVAKNALDTNKNKLQKEYNDAKLKIAQSRTNALNAGTESTIDLQNVNKMLRFQQLKELAEGRTPRSKTELLYKLHDDGELDTNTFNKYVEAMFTAKPTGASQMPKNVATYNNRGEVTGYRRTTFGKAPDLSKKDTNSNVNRVQVPRNE